MQSGEREDWNCEPLGHPRMRKLIAQLVKVLQYQEGRSVVDVCLPFLLCLHSVHYSLWRERADDDVLGMLAPSVFIGRTFLGPTPSTEYINTFRPLNLMINISWSYTFHRIYKYI